MVERYNEHDALSEVRRSLKAGGIMTPEMSGHLRALWAADALGWFEIVDVLQPARLLTEDGRLAAESRFSSAAEYLDATRSER